jgi:C-terminal processing protease CtpA/Prc
VPVGEPEHEETAAEREQEREALRAENFGFRSVSILAGNVGYLDLRNFRRADLARETALAAMSFLAGAQALIIDLRENGGGRPEMVAYLASFLFGGEPFVYSTLERRCDGTTTRHSTERVPDGLNSAGKPIYVLIAPRTFSGAEAFAYELHARKRALLVGETTGGGAHSGATFRVTDHYAAFIPLSRTLSPVTGKNWEGTGIAPDVAVPAALALAAAHERAVEELAAKAASDERRAALQAVLAQLRSGSKER